jgi:dTDP-4-dehydrorhamnose reductase
MPSVNADRKTIAVTGACGQLGGELCRMLGSRAVPLDIDTLDLADRAAVLEKLLAIRPEVIINCAAYTQVDKAEEESELARAVNVSAVENLVEVCRRLNCRLVQISTDYVFGGEGKREAKGSGLRPWNEADSPSPQGVYAKTKWEGEQVAATWEKHVIVRTCGLYARPSDRNAKNFVKTILRLAETRPELRVVNDQRCTPSYVPHVARAILFLAGYSLLGLSENGSAHSSSPKREEPTAENFSGIYHVANRGSTTWHDFAAETLRLSGKSVPLVPITGAEFAAPAPRPFYSVLDTAKYHALGGPEMPEWKIGLQEYFEERVKTLASA